MQQTNFVCQQDKVCVRSCQSGGLIQNCRIQTFVCRMASDMMPEGQIGINAVSRVRWQRCFAGICSDMMDSVSGLACFSVPDRRFNHPLGIVHRQQKIARVHQGVLNQNR